MIKFPEKLKTFSRDSRYTGMNITDNRTAAGFYISGTWSVDGNSPEQIENAFEVNGTEILIIRKYKISI